MGSQDNDGDRYMSIRDLMAYSSYSERTLRKIIHQMNPIRLGEKGKLVVKKSDFDDYMEKRREEPQVRSQFVMDFLKEILDGSNGSQS
jgi:hypothetical protein